MLLSLNSQLETLEAALLAPSTNNCFSILPTDMDLSAPVQPLDTTMDTSDISTDYMFEISSSDSQDVSYGYDGAFTTECYLPDQQNLAFPSGQFGIQSQDLGALYGDRTTSVNTSACSLPYEQLFEELDGSQTQTLSQQREGISMALQLMGHLCYPEDSSSYANLSSSEREYWATTLVERCRKVTKTVSDMLQCHSSEDGYFLAVICLIISKVLDAYVKASQALSTGQTDEHNMSLSPPTSSTSSSSATGSESTGRSVSPSRERSPKAIQQLLDELYQVRASMDLLGVKIASIPSKRDWIFGNDLTPSYYDALVSASPFSAEILNKLYDEQRRRLKTISLQLINKLKAFWVDVH